MKLEKIVVASGNRGKIAEIKAIFTGVEIVSMQELGFDGEIEETGSTFKENAKIKEIRSAVAFGRLGAVRGMPARRTRHLFGKIFGRGRRGQQKATIKAYGTHKPPPRVFRERSMPVYAERQDVLRHGQNVRQNFNRGNRHKRFRIRQPVLFKRLEKELRACNRGRKELGIPPLSRAV